MTTYRDFPKTELLAGADKELSQYAALGIQAHAYFKATCPNCGDRPQFADPDVIYEEMDCCSCGHRFPFVEGNYMLLIDIALREETP